MAPFQLLKTLHTITICHSICTLGALALELDIWTTQSSDLDVVLHAGSRLEVSIEKKPKQFVQAT